jgi:hypothetical protein
MLFSLPSFFLSNVCSAASVQAGAVKKPTPRAKIRIAPGVSGALSPLTLPVQSLTAVGNPEGDSS